MGGTLARHGRRGRAPREEEVPLGDGRVLTARRWPGRGLPLVLLHGLLDSSVGWDALCAASGRPCVAFDVPGFGGSDLPTRPAFSAYAEDVIAGIDALGLDEIVLVGHSLGGGIATAIAERIPERVRALLLLAPAGFGRIALAEAISLPGFRHVTGRVLPVALASRVAMTAAYRTMVAAGSLPADEVLDRVAKEAGTVVPGAVEATKAVVRGGLSKRAFHRRRVDYDGPVFVVWGDRDRLVPIAHMSGVATAFPQADIRVWRGMAHHPQAERPDDLAELVEAAVRRAEAGDGAPTVRAA